MEAQNISLCDDSVIGEEGAEVFHFDHLIESGGLVEVASPVLAMGVL